MRESLATVALLVGSVIGGLQFGAWIRYPGGPPNYASVCAILAGFLTAIGYCVAKLSPRLFATRCSTVCGWSMAYAAALIVFEPFMFFAMPGTPPLMGLATAMMPVPLLFAIGSLLRFREYFSVAGLTLFVFACYALFRGNLSIRDGGAGFFTQWFT